MLIRSFFIKPKKSVAIIHYVIISSGKRISQKHIEGLLI